VLRRGVRGEMKGYNNLDGFIGKKKRKKNKESVLLLIHKKTVS
jgi:hypothetical protein